MSVRTTISESTAVSSTSTDETASKTGRIRWGLVLGLAIGLAAVVYVVSQYADEDAVEPVVEEASERIPTIGAVRERAGVPVADEGREIAIDDSEPTAGEAVGSSTDADETGGADEISDAETNVDVTDEERPSSEIEERASEEVAEPGEMAIDDDVADVVDESETEANAESDAADEGSNVDEDAE
ncbi:hypothetical protein ACLI4Z_15465 [Natrialbaceae archaeon A-arb3/5]